MGNESNQAVIPIEHALVPFHTGEILGMRLPDNSIAAMLASLCALIGIRPHGQAQRIRRDEELSKYLLLAVIETPGGPQRVDVLIVGAIPLWLMGLNLKLIAPEKRALALALKFEAADVLYRYFLQTDSKAAAQPTAKQLPEPDAMWERLYEAMVGFEREWRTMKADMATLRVDIAALKAAQEQRPAGAAAGASQPADDRLSPDHFLHLYVLARSLESRTGEPLGALMRELAAAFQVRDVGELPDSAWDGVLAWFWQRSQR